MHAAPPVLLLSPCMARTMHLVVVFQLSSSLLVRAGSPLEILPCKPIHSNCSSRMTTGQSVTSVSGLDLPTSTLFSFYFFSPSHPFTLPHVFSVPSDEGEWTQFAEVEALRVGPRSEQRCCARIKIRAMWVLITRPCAAAEGGPIFLTLFLFFFFSLAVSLMTIQARGAERRRSLEYRSSR